MPGTGHSSSSVTLDYGEFKEMVAEEQVQSVDFDGEERILYVVPTDGYVYQDEDGVKYKKDTDKEGNPIYRYTSPSGKKQTVRLSTALEDVQAMTATLTGYLMSASDRPEEIYKVGLASVRYLLAVGDLIIGWRLLVQANVAHGALGGSPSAADEAFYQGKIATAAFFAANMLPGISVVRGIVDEIDDEIMRLPLEAF